MQLFTIRKQLLGKKLFSTGELISTGIGAGYVNISSAISGYKINERTFGSIRTMFSASDDYQKMEIQGKDSNVAYSGAEHSDLPNITAIPNWTTQSGDTVFGTSIGHYQESPEGYPDFLELYEITEGFGAIILDKRDEEYITMIIGTKEIIKSEEGIVVGKGDNKILTLNRSIMTIYNLNDIPLITLDFANPQRHKSDKEIQKESGPILLLWREGSFFKLKLNETYIDRNDGFGVKSPSNLEVSIPIDLAKGWRQSLYKTLLSKEVIKKLESLGVKVLKANEKEVANQLDFSKNIEKIESLENVQKNCPSLLRDYFWRERFFE